MVESRMLMLWVELTFYVVVNKYYWVMLWFCFCGFRGYFQEDRSKIGAMSHSASWVELAKPLSDLPNDPIPPLNWFKSCCANYIGKAFLHLNIHIFVLILFWGYCRFGQTKNRREKNAAQPHKGKEFQKECKESTKQTERRNFYKNNAHWP